MVHGLPGIRELNRARAPVLVYNSNHARPYPIIAEQVTPRAGTAPDSIRATLTINGAVVGSGAWPAWAAGTVRQVAVVADAASLDTGMYPYTLEVRAHWNGGASETLRSRSGQMVIVNRGESPFGAGWWLAGVEQIHHVSGTQKLWVGGDGSFRLYRGSSAAGPWGAEGFDRPDTLYLDGGEYRRTLPGGAQVRFGSDGKHLRTVSTLGDTTHFRWQSGRLARLVLPRTTGMGADSSFYVLEYGNNAGTAHPRLSRVRAPWLTGFRDVQVITDSYARVTAITDPYLGGGTAAPTGTPRVQFGYFANSSSRLLMQTRTDRRMAVQQFAHAGHRLSASTRWPSATTTIRVGFWPAENRGVGASIRHDSIHTRMDGPRGSLAAGVVDRYLWRVNRWGAPTAVRARTSTGWVWTTIERGDPRWPALATRVVAAA